MFQNGKKRLGLQNQRNRAEETRQNEDDRDNGRFEEEEKINKMILHHIDGTIGIDRYGLQFVFAYTCLRFEFERSKSS